MLYYYFPFAGHDVPFPCFLSSNCVYLLKTKKNIESIWFPCLAVCHVVLTANVVASFSQQKKEKSCFAFPSTAQWRDHSLGSSYTPGAPSVLIIRLQLQRLHIFYNVFAACIVHVYFTRSCTTLFSSL
jgi:hypothetical protein